MVIVKNAESVPGLLVPPAAGLWGLYLSSELVMGTMVLYLMETEAGGKADLLSTSGQRLMESNPAQSM